MANSAGWVVATSAERCRCSSWGVACLAPPSLDLRRARRRRRVVCHDFECRRGDGRSTSGCCDASKTARCKRLLSAVGVCSAVAGRDQQGGSHLGGPAAAARGRWERRERGSPSARGSIVRDRSLRRARRRSGPGHRARRRSRRHTDGSSSPAVDQLGQGRQERRPVSV